MSNKRKLRPAPPVLYSCAVCRLKFSSWADREAHWRYVKGARLCQDLPTMKAVLGFTYKRGAWMVTGNRRSPAQSPPAGAR